MRGESSSRCRKGYEQAADLGTGAQVARVEEPEDPNVRVKLWGCVDQTDRRKKNTIPQTGSSGASPDMVQALRHDAATKGRKAKVLAERKIHPACRVCSVAIASVANQKIFARAESPRPKKMFALLALLLVAGNEAAPCDVLAEGGTPCVAAHSMVRGLFAAYSGPLYQLKRSSDNATLDIYPLTPGGFADADAHEQFCAAAGPGPAPPLPTLGSTVSLVPAQMPDYAFRHCYSQAFLTPANASGLDHAFKLVAALSGTPGAVSFQSINYPTEYKKIIK